MDRGQIGKLFQIFFVSLLVAGAAAATFFITTQTGAKPGVTWFDKLWMLAAASIPGLLVLQHGLYLQSFRPAPYSAQGRAALEDDSSSEPDFTLAAAEANQEIRRQFGWGAISLDFYFPAALNWLAGAILAYVICELPVCCGQVSDQVQEGIRLGGFGAYVYVTMMLSERAFQRDITTGTAQWSAVQMILGPILGGVVARVVSDGLQTSEFTRQAVFFMAGLAPRQLVSFFQDGVRRFFGGNSRATNQLLPLTQIRGITSRIEDRLFEEGISDGFMLAMANPIRLTRNTSFDERHIIAWIDEALLYYFLPEHAPSLLREGFTGAIDLAHLWFRDEPVRVGGPESEPVGAVRVLAERLRVDLPIFLSRLRAIYEDEQVRTIWTLYQSRETLRGAPNV